MAVRVTTRERVRELRADGLVYREIAERLGISYEHAKKCGSPGTCYETTQRASREAKKRRTGTCESCGGPTRYSGHGRDTSRFCANCNPGPVAMKARRGTGAKTQQLLAFLAEPRRYSEVRDHFGMTSGHAGVALNTLKRYGLARQVRRGVWVAT